VRVLNTIAEMREAIIAERRKKANVTIGFVPTMGALHAGHLALVRAARKQSDCVIASIFVNPLQFGPTEDFSRYPRTFAADCDLLDREGGDYLFAPTAEEMYPDGDEATVDVGAIADRLDGASRPGHFRGVATVVAKLFHIVAPDVAYFGQKDAAQVAVLRKMTRDLNFPLRIEVCDTVREADGLAMSSRNRFLSNDECQQALVLARSLNVAKKLVDAGETNSDAIVRSLRDTFAAEPAARLDYAAVVDADTLLPVENVAPEKRTLVAVAAWIGNTRLIDNIIL
jgi:pantoate--beta-alanine ligase